MLAIIVNCELFCFPLRGIHSSDCFPTSAAGDRNRDSGALENVGGGGFAWSSSPYASGHPNASFLGFKQSYVEPFRTDNRSYALSVRCVQHLHELLFDLCSFCPSEPTPRGTPNFRTGQVRRRQGDRNAHPENRTGHAKRENRLRRRNILFFGPDFSFSGLRNARSGTSVAMWSVCYQNTPLR